MLTEPERTPYDLRFRLLGFPVRVHPWFWIGTALFGASTIERGLQFFAIWIAVVFVSILVHELGHALAFRRFGAGADIVLYAFGGLAVPTMMISGRWRRIIVALAGPGAGFVLSGVVYGSNEAFSWAVLSPETAFFCFALIFVNLYWGIFNLLPVFPLDGGQVCRELCGMKWGMRGNRISLQISIATAILVVTYSILCVMNAPALAELPWWFPRGTFFTAIMFGLLAYTSYQLLQQVGWTDRYWTDDRTPYDRY